MYAVPIWQMKFCTRSVLIDRQKVAKQGKTYLYFCADRNKPNLYSVDGARIWQANNLIWNGKIVCFNVPEDWLENEGPLPEELIPEKEKQYNRFKKFMKKENK